MAIQTYSTPLYMITVKDAFFCFRINTDNSDPQYEATVYSAPTVKSVGIKWNTIDKSVASSGIIYDQIMRKTGAEIALEVVELPREILEKAAPGTVTDAYVVENKADEGTEFAFGTYFERKDGSYDMVWFPRCRLIPEETAGETSTEDDFPDPKVAYTIKAMPLDDGTIDVWYYQSRASGTPLTPAQFFAAPALDAGTTAPQTDFTNIKPVAALPTTGIDATAVYVLTADDGLKLEGTMWRYINEAWVEYTVS